MVRDRPRSWAGVILAALVLGASPFRVSALTLLWDAPEVNDEEVTYFVYARAGGQRYDYSQPICRTSEASCLVGDVVPEVTHYYVVRSFLAPDAYSLDSNEAAYRWPSDWPDSDGVPDTATVLPLPVARDQFSFDLPPAPTIGGDPQACKPLAIAVSDDGRLSISLGLPSFESPVDVYVAAYAPALHPNVLFLSPDGRWTDTVFGWRKWMSGKFGDVQVPLVTGIDYGSLPAGDYYLYAAVAPAGRTDAYYIWATLVTVE